MLRSIFSSVLVIHLSSRSIASDSPKAANSDAIEDGDEDEHDEKDYEQAN